jgi:hypothetical protein
MISMASYFEWVMNYPLLSSAVQFGILGTLGEIISCSIVKKQFALPGKWLQIGAKVLAWALLGIIIKCGFAGMKGFTRALLDHHVLPIICTSGIGWAFAVSILTNTFFGPQMMFFHRLEDNLIMREWKFTGLTRAWWTLLWFWIPAHTITFSLPVEYQIGLAAVWSIVLGLILGLAKERYLKPVLQIMH